MFLEVKEDATVGLINVFFIAFGEHWSSAAEGNKTLATQTVLVRIFPENHCS